MLELEIVLVDGVDLNFDKSFLQFNIGKKYLQRVTFKEYRQLDWNF